MQLIHRKIPREFLEMLPEGMKFINRHGQEFLVVEEVTCSRGHSLMYPNVRIHDEPSICLEVHRPGSEKGLIFVDAYWGSHAKLYSFQAEPDRPMEYVEAFCPHCGVSLVVDRACGNLECDSTKSVEFLLPGEANRIYVCAKLGCPDHSIVVGKVPHEITEEINGINFFGHGDEDEAFGGI